MDLLDYDCQETGNKKTAYPARVRRPRGGQAAAVLLAGLPSSPAQGKKVVLTARREPSPRLSLGYGCFRNAATLGGEPDPRNQEWSRYIARYRASVTHVPSAAGGRIDVKVFRNAATLGGEPDPRNQEWSRYTAR
jgi:hypothetical protein